MDTPHIKAFEYHYHFIAKNGVPMVSKNYLAVTPMVDVETLVKRWNLTGGKNRQYILIGEVDLSTALQTRGVTGASIGNDWKMIPNLKYHGVEWEVQEKV